MKKIIYILLILTVFSCKNSNDVKVIREMMSINGYTKDDYDLDDSFPFKWKQNRLVGLVPLDFKKITVLPKSFGELEQLNRLWLSGQLNLSKLPKSFTNLKNIRDLYLPMNYSYLPEDIGIMNITFLNAPNSKLTKLPKSFGDLPLKQLLLRDCAFNEIPQEICELEELEILIIYPKDRESKMVIPDEIGKLKNLKELEIGGDIVRIPETISELKNLEYLTISPSKGLSEFPLAVYDIESLKYLSLPFSHIEEIPPGISKLKNLECFVLDFNRLTSIPRELMEMENWSEERRKNHDGGPFGFHAIKNEIYDVTPEVDEWLKRQMGKNWAGTQYYREK